MKVSITLVLATFLLLCGLAFAELRFEVGIYPTDPTLADINNDGFVDLLVSNSICRGSV